MQPTILYIHDPAARLAPAALAAIFGWTDAGTVRSLCTAARPAQALPHLTKLMGLDPLEAWRTIT